MSRIILTVIVAFVIGLSQQVSAQSATSEQTTFYTSMQAAYMAWKDNNNIQAVRDRADEVYANAVAWKKSIGKDFPKAAKKDLKKVVKLSKQLKAMAVKTGNDADVKQKIAQIHAAYTDVAAIAGGPTS
jgi:hypothetical protein